MLTLFAAAAAAADDDVVFSLHACKSYVYEGEGAGTPSPFVGYLLEGKGGGTISYHGMHIFTAHHSR